MKFKRCVVCGRLRFQNSNAECCGARCRKRKQRAVQAGVKRAAIVRVTVTPRSEEAR